MKKIPFLILLVALIGTTSSFSQVFKVNSSGKILINNPSFTSYDFTAVVNEAVFSANAAGTGRYFVIHLGGPSYPYILGSNGRIEFRDALTAGYPYIDIVAKNLSVTSNRNLKQNVRSLTSGLEKINQLNPVTYEWIHTGPRQDESGKFLQEIGFIAQEVEEILPELIYTGGEGEKLLNYLGIIPVLTDAVKTLTQEINQLKEEMASTSSFRSASSATGIESADPLIAQCKLYQNQPNPFGENTLIRFFIPEGIRNAQLCIYDLQGKQIKQIQITQQGEGSQTISSSELAAGMYLYSLIADGKEVDTKRMVLTK